MNAAGSTSRDRAGNGRGQAAALAHARRLPIEAGEVACPQRGALAARCCLSCGWFRGAELDAPVPAIRCGFWRAAVVERPEPLGLRLARAWHGRDSSSDPVEGRRA